MGYCMNLVFQQFKIEKSKIKKAHEAIRALITFRPGEGRYGNHFSWVPSDFAQKPTFVEAMRAWRWDVSCDEAGNIVEIGFTGEKLGDDMILFKAIAPYVTKGSYIEMQGEDGMRWRRKFNGKTCKEIQAKITWED